MISPPSKTDIFPGRLPPLRQQWARLSGSTQILVIAVPSVVTVVLLIINVTAGVSVGVMLIGVAAVSAVFVKNRTDRHNAAVDSGEIAVPDGAGLRPARVDDLPAGIRAGMGHWGVGESAIGQVWRFEGGWLITNRNPRDVALVAGDDGGWARYDPLRVPDVWAVSEYLAGRGREHEVRP